METIPRNLQPQIHTTMQAFPAVYINGPRQAGKTTLVKTLLSDAFKAHFITFDSLSDRVAARDNPLHFLETAGTPLIIDEVQIVPELFRPLKMMIDEQRYAALGGEKKPNGRYLLTGSANLLATPALADAMVGRMATLTLLPLSTSEVLGTQSSFIERCFSKDFSNIKHDSTITLHQAIQKASFPELAQLETDMASQWLEDYIQKITLDDPRQLYNLEKADAMPSLLFALATRAGSLINDASIGRDIGLNAITTRTYRTLLNNTFVTHTLPPWYRNINKRLVKSSKIFFHDTHLLCHLLGMSPETLAKKQPTLFGHVLENFVLSELTKENHSRGTQKASIHFYRTHEGAEIDFILEHQQRLVAIEVKHAESVTEKDLAGIKELQASVGSSFHCGIILCNTKRVIGFGKDIYLVPISALWQ